MSPSPGPTYTVVPEGSALSPKQGRVTKNIHFGTTPSQIEIGVGRQTVGTDLQRMIRCNDRLQH
jgi:hypothetical protein